MVELVIISVISLIAIYVNDAIIQIALMGIALMILTVKLMYLIIKYAWKEDI